MKYLGNNLRILRMRGGHTQKEMERLLNIGEKTWSNYENKNSEPKLDILIVISEFFGVTLDELVLEDLDDSGKHPQKKAKPYSKIPKSSKVNENGFEYLRKKVEKLEQRLDSINKSQPAKKSE